MFSNMTEIHVVSSKRDFFLNKRGVSVSSGARPCLGGKKMYWFSLNVEKLELESLGMSNALDSSTTLLLSA